MALSMCLVFCVITASANNLADSEIGQGIRKIVTDVSGFLIILSPLVGAVAFAFCMVRKGMADEQDGKMWQHRGQTAIICGVAGMLGMAVVNLLSSYF